jgi:hypothetical protein
MKKSIIIMAFVLAGVKIYPVLAQQFNMSPVPVDEKLSVGLRVNKPFFKKSEYGENPSGISGVYKLYGYFPLKKSWQVNTEIPLVIVKLGETSETGLGNIYVEFQKALNPDKTTWFAFGLYLPTIGNEKYEKMTIGMISDPYRFLQYTEGVTVNSTFGYNLREKPGILFGVDLGPDIFIPTTGGGDVELLIHYGLKGGYQFNMVSTWAELSGIMIVTQEGGLNEKWINQVFFGAQLNQGKFRPGLFYGIHLDRGLREGINGLLGVNLQVVIN